MYVRSFLLNVKLINSIKKLAKQKQANIKLHIGKTKCYIKKMSFNSDKRKIIELSPNSSADLQNRSKRPSYHLDISEYNSERYELKQWITDLVNDGNHKLIIAIKDLTSSMSLL